MNTTNWKLIGQNVVTGTRRSWFLGVIRLSAAVAILISSQALHAQVSFAGAQSTLGSGFNSTTGVAVDNKGNVYVADSGNNAIKEILAVNGGIPANATILTLALGFNDPDAVAIDASGDVFVASFGDNTVEEIVAVNGGIPANPTILTLGSGFVTPSGLAVDKNGNVFVADMGNVAVKEIVAVNGAIPANPTILVLGGGFTNADGVAVDAAGDVFVADDTSVKEIAAVGGIIPANPTIRTLGSGFVFAHGVAVDTSGDVFVAQTQTTFIEEMVAVNGSIPANPTFLTFGSGFLSPYGVFVDTSGDVFAADAGASDIEEIQTRSVNFGGVNVCPAAVGAPAPCTETLTLNFNFPAGVALDDPIVTTGGAQGLDFTVAANSTCGTAGAAIPCTVNVTFTPSASGVREGAVNVTEAGECIALPCDLPHATTLISGTGLAPEAGIFGILFGIEPATASLDITGVAVAGSGNYTTGGTYYYSDQGGNTVYKVTNGATTSAGFTGLNAPQQLAIDGSGAIYVQTGGSQIIKRAANGVQTTLLSTIAAITPNLEAYLENIGAFALDPQGDIYVGGPAVGSAAGEVVKFDTLGNLTVVGGGYGTIESMTVGPDGTVYIVSVNPLNGSSTVSTIGPSGQQGTLAIALPTISAIAVDAGGTVYLAEVSEGPPFILAHLLVIDATGVETNYQLPDVDIANQIAITPTGGFYIANQSGSQTGNPSGNLDFYSRDATGGFGFNDVPVGTTAPGFPEPVLNIGNEPLTIFGLTYSAFLNQVPLVNSPFSEAPVANSTPKECATTLAGGATCVITDVFSPAAPGAYTGSFTLSDNSLNATAANPTTQTYDLFGTGTGPPIAMTLTGPVPSPLFGSVQGTFTVQELDVAGAPAAGDNNTVTLSLTGPQEYNNLQVTLTNGVGTLLLTLVEGGNYTLNAADATNGLTAGPLNFPLQQNGGLEPFAGITLAASTTTPYYFDQVVITATINGTNTPAPTGSVTYSVDNGPTQSAPLNVGPNGAVNPGTASFLVGPLAVGSHSVSVTYVPTGNFYLQSGPQIINLTVVDPPLSLVSSERLQAFANAGTPNGVAVDGAGDVYLADTAGAQVLEYTPAGARVTFPLDLVTPNGLAVDSFGNIFVSDSSANQLYKYSALTGQQTLSFQGLTPATLNNPGKIAVSQTGSVYVADTGNNRVVFLNNDSFPNVVPANGLNAPQGVAVDTAGDVYIADTGNGRVIKIDTNQNQTTIFSTPDPIAVAVDANANVYVLDGNGSDTVTRIDAQGHQVQLNGVGAFNGFNLFPVDIAADTLGNLFVPGTQPFTPGNQTSADLLVISTNPGIKVQGVPVGGPSETGAANYLIPSAFGVAPAYAASDLSGNTEFAGNQLLNCTTGIAASGICTFTISFNPILPGVRTGSFTLSDANGAVLRTDAVYGTGLAPLAVFESFSSETLTSGTLINPGPIAVDSAGNTYVADTGNGSIFKVPAGGGNPVPVLTDLEAPSGVAVDGLGNVYATDSDGTSVYKVAPGGNMTFLATDLTQPSAIVVDGGGNVFVGESTSGIGEVLKIDPLGNETVVTQGLGFVPTSLALDIAGNVFVLGDGAILKVTPYQNVSPVTFNDDNITALAVDAAGEIYAVDPVAQQIERLDTAGNLTSINNINLAIGGIALDGSGNIYFTSSVPGAVSEITRNADGINFGGVALGAISMAYYFTTTNVGNQPLVFSALTVPAPFGPQPALGDLTSCSGTLTLAAGTDCTLGIDFAPTVVGALQESAVLTSNSLNQAAGTEAVNLFGDGTGVVPASLALTGPNTGVAGGTGTYTITELSASGAPATGDSDLVGVSIVGQSSTVNIDVELADGVGTFTVPFTAHSPVGDTDYTITATDIANGNLTAQLSLVVTQLVTTNLALALNPAAPTTADLVSVVVTLGGDNATLAATGTISYTLDGVASPTAFPVGVPNVAGGYDVSIPLGRLAVGPHAFTASYSGDANHRAAGPAALQISIAPLAVTTTTLTINPATLASGTAVTLTAAVAAGGTPLSPGMVSFCDATATRCENSALVGTAQLTTAGTATLKFVPGIGVHSYKAIFAGTNIYATSASVAGALTVTGLYPTTTTIQATGSQGDYTLTGTVVGTGGARVAPTGMVSFLDTSNGNAVLATAALGASTPGLSFLNSSSPTTGDGPVFVTAGDFNGDGIPDLAVANFDDASLSILLGNGDGTFTLKSTPATGTNPNSIGVGDFNGDGKTDLAVTDEGSATVTILLGNGDGTFNQTDASPATGTDPVSVAVGDFNGDGIPDLAIANFEDDTVTVLLGVGDGTFTPAASPVTGANPYWIASGDFNGDGNADLAVTNVTDNTVSVLLGNGDGTFTATASPATGNNPYYVVVADFNGDGRPDLAVANRDDGTVSILTGNGNGTFAAGSTLASGASPASLTLGDFNGDGNTDLVVADSGGNTVTVLLGSGTGTFTASTAAPVTGTLPYSVTVGDFNGDGHPDIVTANENSGTLTVLLTQLTQTATATAPNVAVPGTGTHNIEASFPANANFSGSVSPTTPLTGSLDTAVVTSTITFGASIPYGPTSVTATVAGSMAGLPVPTGTLGYTIDGAPTVAIPGTLVNGSITFQLSQIAVGNHTIGFAYSGNAQYQGTPNNIVPPTLYVAFTITPAVLTVTANSLTSAYGQTLPGLTDTITGFLFNDTAATAVTGAPALTTTATTVSAPGNYPITAAIGTLAATNYTFTFVPGTLTISQATQTIAFTPIAAKTYGAAAFAAAATATSGLPVIISVQSGPATVANNLVAITGIGTVTLTASQAGNADYLAATPVITSFQVNPATLTVTANPAASVYGQPLPVFSDAITGFVYNDAASVVTGAAVLSTTATPTSAPGNYAITVAKGTLAATNYVFALAPGTLTISQAAQTIAFTPIATQSYGAGAFVATATATSGLPVTISVQSGPATVANNQVTVNGVGTVVLAGSEAGNADYLAAAAATTSFNVIPASSSTALSVTSSVVRTPNPISLSATVTSPVTGETGTVTFLDGMTTLGQSALSPTDTAALNGVTLAVGTHTITASYSGAADFAPSASTVTTVVVEPLAAALTAVSPVAAEAGSSDTTITATGTNFSPTAIVNFSGTPLATTFVNSTQLTAVIPAAQLATAGTFNVTVSDTYSSSTSLPQTFTILPVSAVTFTGPPSTPPGQQPTLIFELTQTYPIALNGTMTLTFTPDQGNPDDPEVQFATGGRTFNFTLPPNSTETPVILLQAGTISGTITVTLQLTASGINVTPANLAPITIVVPKVAPTVTAVTFTTSGDTLSVVVTGYSSTREIQSADFSFTPATGATLAEKSITVPASTLFETWYTTAESAQYGSAFTYTQLFTLSAPATAVGGVGVTLTNTIGTSTEVSSQ